MSLLRRTIGWALGLWQLASGRIRADWRFLTGVWLLLVSATTLLAAGVVYGDAVAVGSLRSSVRSAPAASQGVSVEAQGTPAEIDAADPGVRATLAAGLGRSASTTIEIVRSGSLVRAAPGGGPVLTVLQSVDDLAAHGTLVAGRWPQPGRDPFEAVVSTAAATGLGVHPGDRVPLGDASVPGADPNHPLVTVLVVGTFVPLATDPVWTGDELVVHGVALLNGSTFRGPFVVEEPDLLRPDRSGEVDVTWRAGLDLDRMTADDIEPLRSRLDGIADAARSAFPAGRSISTTVGLKGLLDSIDRSLQVARGAVFLLTLQFAVVAAYAVLLVAGMLADRRRPEIGLLRSRGGSTVHVVSLAFGEAVLLCVPAAIAAPFVAIGIVRLLGRFGPLATTGAVGEATITPVVVVAVAVAGAIAAIVLTLPALAAGAEVAGIRAVLGRPIARTFAQRLGIDVALVAVAAIGIWQLRTYGGPLTRSGSGSLGVDPLLVGAPAIGLLAGGVLATRLVPRLGEAGERILDRARGLLSPLGARQIARRPLRYTRAALLLMLSTALGTFGAIYAATWTASQADQAGYQSGADVRVALGPAASVPSWQLGSAYRAIPGVTAATPVARRDLSVGRVVRTGVLLSADAATLPRVATLPAGPEAGGLAPGLATLAAARPELDGMDLPPGTRWLRVHVDADLHETGPTFTDAATGKSVTIDVPDDYQGLTVTAVVRDADGRLTTFGDDGTEQAALWRKKGQAIVVPLRAIRNALPTAGPADPRSVIGLTVTLAEPFQFGPVGPIHGTFHVLGVDASSSTDATAGAAWTPLDTRAAGGWSWLTIDNEDATETLATGIGPVLLPADDRQVIGADRRIRLVPPLPSAIAVPAIAGDALLAVGGSSVGDQVGGRSAGADVELKIVARTTEFPTISPSMPFMIVDGPTLDLLGFLTSGSISAPNEWWLAAAPGAITGVAIAARTPPFPAATVTDRPSTLAALEADPIGLATLGALVLGSLAAAAFAILGFLVAATVSTRERLGEFALLRALGLSSRQLAGWLAAEQAFLLLVGLLAGIAIGLVLGVLIVPETLLGPSGATVVPVPRVVVPWPVFAFVAGGAIAVLALTVLIVGRPLPGRRIATVLRAAED